MLSVLEKKVYDKILYEKKETRKLYKKYEKIREERVEIDELLENYENIKNSKSVKRIYHVVNVIFIMLSISINPAFIIGNIYSIFGIINENMNIKTSRNRLINSDYKGSREEKELQKSLEEKIVKMNKTKNTISEKDAVVKKYKKIQKEIKYVKLLKENCKNEKCDEFNKLKELYSDIPILAFDSKEEYNNYIKCNNQVRKGEMISAKILSKRK